MIISNSSREDNKDDKEQINTRQLYTKFNCDAIANCKLQTKNYNIIQKKAVAAATHNDTTIYIHTQTQTHNANANF